MPAAPPWLYGPIPTAKKSVQGHFWAIVESHGNERGSGAYRRIACHAGVPPRARAKGAG